MKIYLFKKTVLNCKQATLLSLKKEEGKISFGENIKLIYHLLYCKYCKRFIKQSSIINHLGETINESLFSHPTNILPAESKENIQRQVDSLGQ
jgi:hypothetical protein